MDQNRIWCALVMLACKLTAWLQLLNFTGHEPRRWEPKRLRHRILSTAGRIAVSGRRTTLHLTGDDRWTWLLLDAANTLRGLAAAPC